ncbi:tandem-95 repeat protein [Cobetia sp. cqz5-12]|uniref:VCBS domain-containing protein n=1 Tax=Cobetia sp. cqz5-12 TaxID=2609415 RepID=UPI001902D364|nr:VCBS domain-containing protein [Cobetia sp. cqz5-12]QQK64438.1 tandem-95 repeat protein [Cobetia sp. cqz5-12]
MRELDLQALEPRLLLDAAAAVTIAEGADSNGDKVSATDTGASLSGTEDTQFSLSSLSVTDSGNVDDEGNTTDEYSLTLQLDQAAADAGAEFSSGGSSATLTGTAQQITDQLAGLVVTPGDDYTADITLSLSLTETTDGVVDTDRGSLDFVATLTPVNDDPVFGDSGATVTEAGSFTFSIEALGLSDPDIVSGEQDTDQLIIEIDSLPTGGSLTFNGSPVAIGSSFDADQLSKLVYTHGGSDVAVGDSDSFAITVVDGAGGEASNTLNIELIPDNAAPTVTGDPQQFEGENTSLGLSYTDEESGHADAAANATVEITDLGNLSERGTLYLDLNQDGIADADEIISDTSDAAASFTADKLEYLSFAHDGDEPIVDDLPSFTIKVTDAGGGEGAGNELSSERTVEISILENDDDPTLTPTTDVLDATDGAVLIDASALNALDPDSTDDQLSYKIDTLPSFGEIQILNGSDWVKLPVGGTFSQAQVTAGEVRYQQTLVDGTGGTADDFTFTLVDSEFKAFEEAGDAGTWGGADSPTVGTLNFLIDNVAGGPGEQQQETIYAEKVNNTGVIVSESTADPASTAVVITDDMLKYGAELDGYVLPATQIVYTVTNIPTNGTLFLDGQAISDFGSFTQEDIDNGLVTFLHDGSEDHESSFTFTILPTDIDKDPDTLDPITDVFTIDATPVNDAPVAGNSSVGLLEKTDTTDGIVRITNLVMSDVDGSLENLDGEGESDDLWFQITSTELSGGSLEVWDGDSWEAASTDVWYSQAILTAQADGQTGGLRYVHDGGESVDSLNDSFTFIVRDDLTAPSDPFATDASTPIDNGNDTSVVSNVGNVTIEVTPFNDAPLIPLTSDAANQTVIDALDQSSTSANDVLTLGEGETAVIDNSLLQAVDSDNTTRQSTFVITSLPENGTLTVNGKVLRVGSSFTQADIDSGALSYEHDGGEGHSDEFTFTVSDGPLTTDVATFSIDITPLNDAPTLTALQPDPNLVTSVPLTLGNAFTIADVDIDDGNIDAPDEEDQISITLVLNDADGNQLDGGVGGDGALAVDITSIVGVDLTQGVSGLDTRLVLTGEVSAVQEALTTLTAVVNNDLNTRLNLVATVDDRLSSTTANGGEGNEGGDAISDENNTVTESIELLASTENDAPVVTLPAPGELTVVEDSNWNTLSGISVADPDSFDEEMTVEVSVAEGSVRITAANAGDATVSGNNSGTITVTGTLDDVNTALAKVQYRPATNDNGTVALTVTATDSELHGSGTAETGSKTTDITVTAVNDEPVLTSTTPVQTMDDGQPLTITGLSVADINDVGQEVFTDSQTVTVTVRGGATGETGGTLNMDAAGVTGNGTSEVTLTGTLSEINAALDDLVLTAAEVNADTSVILDVEFSDDGNGNLALANAFLVSTAITVNVSGTNDTPTITVGNNAPEVDEDGSLTLSELGVTLADADDFGADNLTLTLTVVAPDIPDRGTFSNGSETITFTGTVAELQTVLDTEVYKPADDYYGQVTLNIVFNDAGNTGQGGAQIATRDITLAVTPVNDRPVADGADESIVAIAEDTAAVDIAGTDLYTLLVDQYDDTTDDQTDENGNTAATTETDLTYVAIVGNTSTDAQGEWEYSTDGGSTWEQIPGNLRNNNALILPADADIRFVPADDFNGEPGALTVRLGDDSAALVASTDADDLRNLNQTANGDRDLATGVWSSRTIAINTSITAVNDAPATPDDSVILAAINEDDTDPAGATIADLVGDNFDDASADDQTQEAVSGGSSANALAGIAITSNPADDSEGTWQYSTDAGASWTDVPADVSASNALVLSATDSVRFLPAEDFNGDPTGLTYVVADDSSGAVTSGSSVDVSTFDETGIWSSVTDADTLNTTVNAINDAPVLSGGTAAQAFPISAVEAGGEGTGTNEVSLVAGASLSDVDTALVGDNFGGGTITVSIDAATAADVFAVDDSLAGFAGASLADGTLTVTLDSGATAAQVSALIDSLTYQNTSDDPDTDTRAYTIVVNDGNNDGLAEIDGAGLDSNVLTGYLQVVDTNDGPVANDDADATDEGVALSTADTPNLFDNDTDLDTPTDDFTITQVNGNSGGVGSAVSGSEGGSFTVNADGTWSFDPGADFDGLTDGESAVTTITYQVSDGEGGVSTATVSVTVNGVDDTPTLTPDTGNVTEDTDVTSDNLTTSGTLDAGTGGDNGEDKFTPETVSGSYGALVVDADGNWSYSADNTQDVIQQLNQGATLTDTLTVTNADGVTQTTVSITITGVNDAPVAVADTGETAENLELSVAAEDGVLANDTDIDTGSTGTVSQVAGDTSGVGAAVAMAGGGTVTIAADGSYVFAPGTDFDYLAEGATATTTVAYTVIDDNGAESSNTLTITVTGTNDVPAVVETQAAQESVDGQAITPFDVVDLFADADDGAVLTYSATELPDGLSIDPDTGVISGTLTSDASQGGSGGVHTVTLTATDENNAPVTTTFTWTVANVDPVAQDNSNAISEGLATDSVSTADGNVISDAGTDSDGGNDNDAIVVSGVGAGANQGTDEAAGTPVAGSYGSVTIAEDGRYTYTLDNTDPVIQALDVGDSLTDTFTYEVSDGQGGTDTALLTITINGTNDAPVAADDASTTDEDTALATNDTTNVLGNDVDVDADSALVVSQVNGSGANVGQPVTGSEGGDFTLNADGSWSFDPSGDFEALKDGESAVTTLTYQVSDGLGGVSTATVSVTINGVDDVPTLTPAAGDVTEDIAVNGEGDLVAAGTLAAGTGGDAGEDKFTAGTLTGEYGELAVDTDGNWAYSADNAQDAVQQLNQGVELTDTFTVTNADGVTTTTVTITLTGVNDAPVAEADTVTTAENANLVVDAVEGVLSNDTDIDTGSTSVVSQVAGTAAGVDAAVDMTGGGSITIAEDGSYTFAPGSDFDTLAVGESATTTIAYTVQDDNGAESSSTLTITVTGTNDAPIVVATQGDQTHEDGEAITEFSVASLFEDVDNGAELTYSAAQLPDGLSLDPQTGVISGTLSSDASQGGTDGVHTVVLTADDGNGGVITTSFTWTVANVVPVAEDNSDSLDEGVADTSVSQAQGNVINDAGTDSDGGNDNDDIVVSGVGFGENVATGSAADTEVSGTYGAVVIEADGSYTYTLDNSNAAVQALDIGDSLVETFTYEISDGQGGVATALLTLTINGTNDAPVLVDNAQPVEQNDADGDEVTPVDVSTAFADVDGDAVLTYSAANLPDGLTIDPDTGVISGTLTSDASQGGTDGAHSVTVTATDEQNATVTSTFVWNIDNVAPVAQDNIASVSEGLDTTSTSATGGNVLTDAALDASVDADGGNDTDTLSVSGVGAGQTVVDAATTASGTYGSLSLDSAGDYDYTLDNTNPDVQALAVGESVTETFTYAISDGQGGSDTAELTITINGTNDAPAITIATGDSISAALSESDSGLTAAGTLTVTDVDTSDSVTPTVEAVVADGDVNGLSDAALLAMFSVDGGAIIDGTANDGTLNWGFDSSALPEAFDHLEQGEVLTLTYQVDVADGNGGTDTQDVMLTITGTNDAPVLVAGAQPQDQSDNDGHAITPFSVADAFADVDNEAVLSFAADNLPPGLVIDADTGEISGTLSPDASIGGDDGVYTVTLTATDENGAEVTTTFTWSVANVAPQAENDAAFVTEGLDAGDSSDVSGNVLAAAGAGVNDQADSDGGNDSDALVVSGLAFGAVPSAFTAAGSDVEGNYGAVIINEDGTYTYALNNAHEDVQALAEGEVLSETFTYQISDGQGGTDTALLTITINGSNDAPLIAIEGDDSAAEALTETDDTLATSGTLSVSDLDTSDIVTSSIDSVTATGDTDGLSNAELLGMLSVDADAIIDGEANDGTLNWSFDSNSVAGEAFDHLAVGESLVLDYTVVVTDSQGASAEQVVSININGTNDAPVIAVEGDDSASADLFETNAPLSADGTLSVSDLDTTDDVTPSVTAVAADGDTDGLSNAELLSMLSVDADAIIANTENDGTLNWAFDSANLPEAFDHLALDETLVLDYTVQVTDSQGATAEQVVTITITGTNDAPVLVADAQPADQADNDGDPITPFSVADAFTDIDNDTVLSFSADNLPDGIEIDPTSGEISGTLSTDASIGGDNDDGTYTVILTATDENGATVTTSFTWTVANVAPEAFDNVADLEEGIATGDTSTATGNVLDDAQPDADTDGGNDSDALIVSGIGAGTNAGTASAVDTDVTGTYGSITVAEDGSYTYTLDNTNPDVQALAVGESLNETFTYQISDGQGGFDTALLTITINSTNDAPVIDIDGDDSAAAILTETDATLSAAGTLSVSDVDTTDEVTPSVTAVTADGDVDGLTNDQLLGMLSVDADAIINGEANDGTLNWTFDSSSVAGEAFDHLAVGESLVLDYTVVVTDSQGATAEQVVQITINGTNDVPVIAIEGDDSAAESLTETDDTLATSGTLSVSDLDTSDEVTPSVTAVTATGDTDDLSNAELLSMLSVDADAIIDGVSNDGTLNWTFDSSSVEGEAFDHLAVGESLVLDYTVVVTDSQGATAEQVVSITINGSNDAPVIALEGDDSASESLTETDDTLTTAGTLSVSDLDTTDEVTPSVTAVTATGDTDGLSNAELLSMLSVDADAIIDGVSNDGTLNWTFDSSSVAGEAFDHLAVGESLVLDYTVVVTDSQGVTAEQVVSITINGSNDAPVIAIEGDDSASESLTETDDTLTTAGTLSVSDLDTTDEVTPSVTAVTATGDTDGLSNAELLSMLSVDADAIIDGVSNDGTLNWTFDSSSVAGEAFDHLAVGESLVLDYTVVVTDRQGVTAEQVVSITISGTNDAPVIAIEGDDSAAETLTETDATLTTSGTLSVSDLDTTDEVMPSVTAVTATGDTDGLSNDQLLGMLSVDADAIIDGANNDGTLNWTFDSSSVEGEAFDHLAVGESLVLDYTVVVTDSQGATAEQVVSITINGSNDAPVIAIEGDDSAAESLTETDAPLTTAGTLSVSDLDTTDEVTPSVTAVTATGDTDGLSNAELLGMLSVDADAIIDGANNDGTLNWTFDSSSVAGEAFDHLAVGESLVLDYTVVVTDSQGVTAEQVVSITINGTNDAPVIAIEGDDSAAESLTETDDTLTTAGTLSVSDLDTSDEVTPSVTAVTATGDTDGLSNAELLGMLSVDADAIIDGVSNDGTLNWTFDSSSVAGEAFDHLAVGESLVLDYTVVVTDSQGATAEQVVSITINGSNDAPVIAIEGDDSASETLTETDDTLTTAGTLSVSDLDTTDEVTPSVTAVTATGDTDGLSNAELLGMLSVDADAIIDGVSNDGTLNWTFDSSSVAGEAFDHLAVGESLVLDYTVVVTDSQGVTAEQVVSITINGTNDAPVIAIEGDDSASESLTETDDTLTTAGTLSVSDLDTSDEVTPSVTAVTATGDTDDLSNAELLGMLSVDADAIIDGVSNDGTLNWTFDSSSVEGEAFDHLAVGESLVLDYTVVVTDSQGATAEQVVQITINGSNDAPVIAIEGDDSASESLTETDDTLATSGTLSVSDLDTTDEVTPSVTAVTATGDTDGLSNAELLGMLSVDADAIIANTENDGTLNWTFDSSSVAGEAFDHLAVGESLVLDYTVVVTDSQGATAEQVVQITINGSNDAPVLVDGEQPIDQSSNDGDPITPFSVADAFTDIDNGAELSFSADNLPDGLVIDPATGEISGTLSPDASAGGDNADGIYTVTLTGTDENGAGVTTTFTWTVANVAPQAFDNTAELEEGVAISDTSTTTGNVLSDGDTNGDVDVDGGNDTDTLVVSGIGAGANADTDIAAGTPVTGTYGSVTIAEDGSYTYTLDNINAEVQALAEGEVITETFTYEISDGQGGTDTALLTVTINGTNDAPRATLRAPQVETGSDGEEIAPISLQDAFQDVDSGAQLSYTAENLPDGLVIDPVTGVISGTIANDASQSGNTPTDGRYTVTVTATDEQGQSADVTLNFFVANVAPDAFDNTAELDEGIATSDTSTTTGNVLSDGDINGDVDIDGGNDTDALVVSGIGAGTNAGTDTAAGTPVTGTYGSVTIAEDGSYTYTLDNINAEVQALAEGEVITETFTYEISDGQGGTDTALLTVTINGTNDAPRATLRAPQVETGSDGEEIAPISLQDAFQDVDSGAQLSYTAENLPDGLVIDPVTGVISGTIANDASQSGNTPTDGRYTVTVTATDEQGQSADVTLNFFVANVAPEAFDNTAELDEGIATSDTSTTTGNVLSDGDINGDVDIDGGNDTDALVVSGIGAGANAGTDTAAGRPVTGTYGSVTIAEDGSYTYTLDNSNAAVQALADGEVLTDTFTYQIDDGQGGTDTALLTVTINGTNDAPVLVDDAQPADQSANDGDTITPFTIADAFTDVDDGAVLTYSVDNLPDGLVIDSITGEISGTLSSDASTGGDNNDGIYTVTLTGTDENGLDVTTTFTFEVENPAPLALDQSADVSEDGVTTAEGSLLVDADGEPVTIDGDGDSLLIASINGQAVAGSDTVIQGTYGQLIISVDGTWKYVLDNDSDAIQSLDDGQQVTDDFSFVVSDGEGGTAAGELTIRVAGLSDNVVPEPVVPVTPVEGSSGNGYPTGRATAGSDEGGAGFLPEGDEELFQPLSDSTLVDIPSIQPVQLTIILRDVVANEAVYEFALPAGAFESTNNEEIKVEATRTDGSPLPDYVAFDSDSLNFRVNRALALSLGVERVDVKVIGRDESGNEASTTFVIYLTPEQEEEESLEYYRNLANDGEEQPPAEGQQEDEAEPSTEVTGTPDLENGEDQASVSGAVPLSEMLKVAGRDGFSHDHADVLADLMALLSDDSENS